MRNGNEGGWSRVSSPALFVSLSLSVSLLYSNHDVFNALDILENAPFLEDLKFGIGDGQV